MEISEYSPQPNRWKLPNADGDKFHEMVHDFARPLLRFAELSELARPDNWLPKAESMAMSDIANGQEIAEHWHSDPVRELQSAAELRLIVAEDLLIEMVKSFSTSPVSVFGGQVILRGCLENSAIVSRLMDPKVDVKLRVARAYSEALYSLAQQKRLPADVRPLNLKERQKQIVGGATASGMNVSKVDGEYVNISEPRPSMTAAVTSILDERWGKTAYSVLCAVAHGTQYGLAQQVRAVDGQVSFDQGPIGAIGLSVRDCIVHMGLALLGYGDASNRLGSYFGWSTSERDAAWLECLQIFGDYLRKL